MTVALAGPRNRRATGKPSAIHVNMPTKACVGCGVDFRLHSGVQKYCTYACYRNSRLENRYGLDRGEWQRMFDAQDGKCALCGVEQKGWNRFGDTRPLVVDHSHTTGKARALLCGDCNTAIGRFGDDPAKLRAAADYLDKHTAV